MDHHKIVDLAACRDRHRTVHAIRNEVVRAEGEDEAPTKGRAFCTLTFHSLRHSFVTHLANAGVADELRMKLTGHTNSTVHARYTKIQLDPLKAAIAKLPSAC